MAFSFNQFIGAGGSDGEAGINASIPWRNWGRLFRLVVHKGIMEWWLRVVHASQRFEDSVDKISRHKIVSIHKLCHADPPY